MLMRILLFNIKFIFTIIRKLPGLFCYFFCSCQPIAETIEDPVDTWNYNKCKQGGRDQTSDNGKCHWSSERGTFSDSYCKWKKCEYGSQACHKYWSYSLCACKNYCFF